MALVINMAKAKIIHMNKIREVRNVKLGLLDIPFMRAIEAGDQDSIRSISNAKQILRDIPQTFLLDEYLDPDSLKAAWPEGL